MRQRSIFRIDLNEIEGEGEFACPRCGEIISPDDFTDSLYEITDTEMKEDDSLEEITLLCKKCGSVIHLVGFEALEQFGESDDSDMLLGDSGEMLLASVLRDEGSQHHT